MKAVRQYIDVGERLRLLRGNQTQTEIANDLGITLRGYQYFESGERQVPVPVMTKIAKIYGVSVGWILTGEEKPKWYEILRSFGITGSFFNINPDRKEDVFESKEMINVLDRIYKTVLAHKNLIIVGDVGTGKTLIFNKFLTQCEDGNIKVTHPHGLEPEKYHMGQFYDIIIRDISGEGSVIANRLDKRELQAKKALENIHAKPVALVVDNASEIHQDVLRQLVLFQQDKHVKNLSIILFGLRSQPLESLPKTERAVLHCLAEDEIPTYIKSLSDKAGGKLPSEVPPEIFQGAKNFYDIQDRYLEYAWRQSMASKRTI